MQDCLALGAIFATTDSVAVLQVLEQDRAPLLFSLVFGEGVINDATTVALLRTVQVTHPTCPCQTSITIWISRLNALLVQEEALCTDLSAAHETAPGSLQLAQQRATIVADGHQ